MKKNISIILPYVLAGLLVVGLIAVLCVGAIREHNIRQQTPVNDTLTITNSSFEKVTKLYGADGDDSDRPSDFTYYRCKLTDVMYVAYDGGSLGVRDNLVGFTVMMKADGTPMLYSEWIELLEANEINTTIDNQSN